MRIAHSNIVLGKDTNERKYYQWKSKVKEFIDSVAHAIRTRIFPLSLHTCSSVPGTTFKINELNDDELRSFPGLLDRSGSPKIHFPTTKRWPQPDAIYIHS